MILRHYQLRGIDSLGKIFAAGKRRAILYLATGGGKTALALEVIKRAIAKSRKVLFICNRIQLIQQTSQVLDKYSVPHGIIQGDNTCMTWEPVQVCSIQTLDSRGYPEADIVLIDEAHGTAGSKAYQKLMAHYSTKFIVGLTATPFAAGMAKVYPWGAMWEDMAVAATIRELIDEGYLVDCEIYSPGEPDLSKVKIVAGDYNEEQLGEAVDKQELIGDIVSHWQRLGQNKSTVCFATNIAHSKHIVEQFTAAGITAEHIDCYTTSEDRRSILDRFKAGEIRIVSNVGILSEGFDFPQCEVMILARPTRSLIRYIQMAGRVLRPFEGKDRATILDHSGTCRRLGFPTEDLPLFLDDGKPKDAKTKAKKEKEQKEKELQVCPQCSVALARTFGTNCPRCGHEFPKKQNTVDVMDGELVKLTRRKGKLIETPYADRVKTYAELRGYAAQTGKRDGWSWYLCRELFGSAPREKPEPQKPTEETLKLIKYMQIKKSKRLQKDGAYARR